MKKTFVTFLFLLAMIVCHAQEQEHLTFRGVPIEGDLNTFVGKLEKLGYRNLGIEPAPNTVVLTGEFTNKDAMILVVSNENKQNVWKVGVLFDASDSWDYLVSQYDYYKELYTKKYGKPVSHIESFEKDYYKDSGQLFALSQGWVKYESFFEVDNGDIKVSIAPFEYGKGTVVLEYQDKKNAEVKSQNDLDDI